MAAGSQDTVGRLHELDDLPSRFGSERGQYGHTIAGRFDTAGAARTQSPVRTARSQPR